MSHAATTWAKSQKTGDSLTAFVLRILADYADVKTGECWPSLEVIADEAEMSISTVKRRLALLQSTGLIVRFDGKTKFSQTGQWRNAKTIVVFNDKIRNRVERLQRLISTNSAEAIMTNDHSAGMRTGSSDRTTAEKQARGSAVNHGHGSLLSHKENRYKNPFPPNPPETAAPAASCADWLAEFEQLANRWPNGAVRPVIRNDLLAKLAKIRPDMRSRIFAIGALYLEDHAVGASDPIDLVDFMIGRRWVDVARRLEGAPAEGG